jgi:phosphate transport system protein
MASEHIVKSYGRELGRYRDRLLTLADDAERQLEKTISALSKTDVRLAEEVIRGDENVNTLQSSIDAEAARLLALRQPMGNDFREIIAGLKIAGELERIADYARNIARHVLNLNAEAVSDPVQSLLGMGETGLSMVRDVRRAFENGDLELARAVWERDDEMDAQYAEVVANLRELLSGNSTHVDDCTALLFISRSLERIGDHAVNIAENIYYIGTGEASPPCR